MTNREWFRYEERIDPLYNPLAQTDKVVTHRLSTRSEEEFDSPKWTREVWWVRSALVSLDTVASAGDCVTGSDCEFMPDWVSPFEFDFGESKQINGCLIYPLVLSAHHLLTGALEMELRQDFIRYHRLEQKDRGAYYSQIDGIRVAKLYADTHDLYAPTPRVEIHRHYLRDYLAARKMALLVTVVADRLRNATEREQLEIDEEKYESLGEWTAIRTSVHPPDFTSHGYYRGRSSLYWNLVLEPYDRPRVERSPWPFHGSLPPDIAEVEPAPFFIVDDSLTRLPLSDPKCPKYLFFRREALQKYLKTPGYRVHFHMRNWGAAAVPGGVGSIDVGINSEGLVNAFAPDLAKLKPEEQAYWASFSSLPSGEICEELFRTRMLCDPPDSPGVCELVRRARNKIDDAFHSKWGNGIYSSMRPSQEEQNALSVGPVSEQFSEVCWLAKVLYSWTVEGMNIGTLRNALSQRGATHEAEWKQIKLLEELLKVAGVESGRVAELTGPLRLVNELRICDAHLTAPDLQKIFDRIGTRDAARSSRVAWAACVDTVSGSLTEIASPLG